jgi:hypothetical protein
MLDMMSAVTGMLGGGQKVEASMLQNVMGMVQNHMSQNNNQPQADASNALSGMVAEKLGMNAGMVQMVMPQLMQAVQNGAMQNLLDKNNDGKIDLADLMGLLGSK